MPKLDEHLTNYYQLTDEGRRDIDSFIEAQLQIKKESKKSCRCKENYKMVSMNSE